MLLDFGSSISIIQIASTTDGFSVGCFHRREFGLSQIDTTNRTTELAAYVRRSTYGICVFGRHGRSVCLVVLLEICKCFAERLEE